MKLELKQEHFESLFPTDLHRKLREIVAKEANARLREMLPALKEQVRQEMLKQAPVVYFTYWSGKSIGRVATVKLEEHTHSARLVEIVSVADEIEEKK